VILVSSLVSQPPDIVILFQFFLHTSPCNYSQTKHEQLHTILHKPFIGPSQLQVKAKLLCQASYKYFLSLSGFLHSSNVCSALDIVLFLSAVLVSYSDVLSKFLLSTLHPN
jgi:hypothetical protein